MRDGMKFHVGDPVVHWTYGLGHVVGIEERIISNKNTLYYAISAHDLTVWVPADNQLETRLRPPTAPKDFRRLFSILTGAGEPLPEDRQERRLILIEKLKVGQAKALCHVIRDLASYEQVHPLNDNDHVVMKRSCDTLLGEWSFVLSVPMVEAESELRRMLATGKSGASKKP